jgi:hypothetical protein
MSRRRPEHRPYLVPENGGTLAVWSGGKLVGRLVVGSCSDHCMGRDLPPDERVMWVAVEAFGKRHDEAPLLQAMGILNG